MSIIGYWLPSAPVAFTPSEVAEYVQHFRYQCMIVQHPQTGAIGIATQGEWAEEGYPVLAILPAMYPEWLGNRSFAQNHSVRFPYVSGAMANGIATTDLVIAIVKMGGMGFFGAAGLPVQKVSEALDRLQAALGLEGNWGSNLIHSPNEPELEQAIVELYLRRGVRRISAAAYMKLSPFIVRYALKGIFRDENGVIQRPNLVFAKISRPEVARHFMSPPPTKMVQELLEKGWITPEEAALAPLLSVAEDIIVESDSGGHTDNQALSALFPSISQLRDEVQKQYGFQREIRLGAAGGLGDPQAVAAAFSMGADFCLTGSINQGCIESGLHPSGKELLAKVGLGDVMMAPAADMFELGVEVQVLKRGSMFGVRALKLYEGYRHYDSLWSIQGADKVELEKILKNTVEQAWSETQTYWEERDGAEAVRAQRDPKHQMALLFRSYLGLSSKWAIHGLADRKLDYQIWCGPAMASFNQWAKGSFLEKTQNRQAAQVARNLLEGACQIIRAEQLRACGVAVPASCFVTKPILWNS